VNIEVEKSEKPKTEEESKEDKGATEDELKRLKEVYARLTINHKPKGFKKEKEEFSAAYRKLI
jgi:hypothetical protein